ncbi:hypothetical protein [Halorussus halophilus]|uniref:hypothetical protein n=1 Tax=Halorussus halophilus TaxID=2650975 RepID=UPI0013011466|nr:hypothetical protein [Halorussus halophilus]
MSQHDPTKRIPKSLGTDSKLFGRYTLTDLSVALLPGVLVLLVMQVVLPASLTIAGYRVQTLTLPIAGLAIAFGGLFVFLTPSYASSVDWLETFARFHTSSTEHNHEQAKQYTQVERVHPERDAIERTDGTFIGLVQVNPPTMALATDEEWQAKASAFRDFLNTTVEFPIQIYSTTQSFPVEEYLNRYRSRLNDRDVQSNPQLAALIEHYTGWYEAELDERQMTIRDHYVVVTVAPREVQFERESLSQKLTDLPIVGLLVQVWFGPHPAVQQEQLAETLDERLRQVQSGLREIDDCNARRVDATDASQLIGEFWAGDAREYGDMASALRTNPFVRGKS